MSGIRPAKLGMAALGLFVSLGSKHIKDDVNDVFETMLSNIVFRRLLVFAVAYTYSSDILSSIIVTIMFIMILKITQTQAAKRIAGKHKKAV